MKITLDILTQWDACSAGKETFAARFPEGAEYKDVIAACDKDGHSDYRKWIFVRAFPHLEVKEVVEAETDLIPSEIEKGLEPLKQLENGDLLKEDDVVSKENSSQLAASGRYSRLAASGDDSRLAASGFNSQLAASGRYSQLAASGDDSIIASSGFNSKFSLGKGGCAAIPYKDENDKTRFAVAYVGENIEADTWYQVNAQGEFVKTEV